MEKKSAFERCSSEIAAISGTLSLITSALLMCGIKDNEFNFRLGVFFIVITLIVWAVAFFRKVNEDTYDDTKHNSQASSIVNLSISTCNESTDVHEDERVAEHRHQITININ